MEAELARKADDFEEKLNCMRDSISTQSLLLVLQSAQSMFQHVVAAVKPALVEDLCQSGHGLPCCFCGQGLQGKGPSPRGRGQGLQGTGDTVPDQGGDLAVTVADAVGDACEERCAWCSVTCD